MHIPISIFIAILFNLIFIYCLRVPRKLKIASQVVATGATHFNFSSDSEIPAIDKHLKAGPAQSNKKHKSKQTHT